MPSLVSFNQVQCCIKESEGSEEESWRQTPLQPCNYDKEDVDCGLSIGDESRRDITDYEIVLTSGVVSSENLNIRCETFATEKCK